MQSDKFQIDTAALIKQWTPFFVGFGLGLGIILTFIGLGVGLVGLRSGFYGF